MTGEQGVKFIIEWSGQSVVELAWSIKYGILTPDLSHPQSAARQRSDIIYLTGELVAVNRENQCWTENWAVPRSHGLLWLVVTDHPVGGRGGGEGAVRTLRLSWRFPVVCLVSTLDFLYFLYFGVSRPPQAAPAHVEPSQFSHISCRDGNHPNCQAGLSCQGWTRPVIAIQSWSQPAENTTRLWPRSVMRQADWVLPWVRLHGVQLWSQLGNKTAWFPHCNWRSLCQSETPTVLLSLNCFNTRDGVCA